MSSPIFALGDEHVRRFVELQPTVGAFWGAGRPDRLSDWSPAAADATAELARRTLRELARLTPGSAAERRAALVMRERLETDLVRHAAGDHLRTVEVLFAPPFLDRLVLAMTDDPALLGSRLASVPAAVRSWQQSLAEGLARGIVASRRLTREMARALRATLDSAGGPSYFAQLACRAGDERLAGPAEAAYADAADWLESAYLPGATEQDAAGPERYARELRAMLGGPADPAEAFSWAWDELRRIEDRMRQVARRLDSARSLPEVADWLDAAPEAPVAEGEAALLGWLQQTMDEAIDRLDGSVIDLAPELRRLEACAAPPGSAAAMYYSPPSEDLSRPGQTWYPVRGQHRFPLWRERSIAYHEGVPGHHLDRGTTMLLRAQGRLSRFGALLGFYPGYSEGWAMYAERLMAELGFFAEPAYELGHYAGQALRAARIVFDAGVHCGLRFPAGSDVSPGAVIDPDNGLAFLLRHGWMPESFLRSEVDRYLGLPGQASCYKLGERAWLDVRERVRTAYGSADLRRFHRAALQLGSLPLEVLGREVLDAYAEAPE